MLGRHRSRVIVLAPVLAVAAAAGIALQRFCDSSAVTAQCCDCEQLTVLTLSQNASNKFRTSWKGVGSITPQRRGVPIAVFQVDRVDVWWDGSELIRNDWPISGYCGVWKFALGKEVIDATKDMGNFAKLQELVSRLENGQ